MTGLNTVEQVVEALAQRYDGPTKQVKGSGGKSYTYIPWNESAKQMTAVFGPLGWDEEIVAFHANAEQGIYTATVRLTARAVTPDGGLVTIRRDGQGVGLVTGEFANAHDTAIKAAASDGFSRAAKLLGDAFGLYLYDKDDTTSGDQQGYRQQQSSGGYRPQGNAARQPFTGTMKEPNAPATEAQIKMLRLKGYDGSTDGLTKAQASQLIGSLN